MNPIAIRNLLAAIVLAIVLIWALAVAGEESEGAVLHEARPAPLAICDVFGARYCAAALEVAWCESRFKTGARNGQYLGLFQMGSWERRRFGHGPDAHSQARAAHRYFNRTGRDWSPWSCKPRRSQ